MPGPQGAPGAKGDTGATGPQGPAGPAGPGVLVYRGEQDAGTVYETTVNVWHDVPGASVGFALVSAAEVDLYADGVFRSSFASAECSLRFLVNGVSDATTNGDVYARGSSWPNVMPFSRLKPVSLPAGTHQVKVQLATTYLDASNGNPCMIPEGKEGRVRLRATVY